MKKYDLTDLEQLKEFRIGNIDARTGELIAQGYEYPAASGKYFSTSIYAQSNLHAMKADPAAFVGMPWSTLDNSYEHIIADSADALAIYNAAFGVIAGYKISGTTLRTQIRNAVDIAAVNAIVDNR